MAAEAAVEKTFNKLELKGRRLVIRWAKSQGKRGEAASSEWKHGAAAKLPPVPGLPAAPLGGEESVESGRERAASMHYRSQDPSQLGKPLS